MLTDDQIVAAIPRLRRYAAALTGDRAAADDLVQDCLERALGRRALFRPSGEALAWLFKIMHNLFLNNLRTQRRRPEATLHDADVPAVSGSQTDYLDLAGLERALAALSPEQRSVVVLVALEDMTYEQAAQALGIPAGTLMSRLHRGRERLRGLLQGEDTPTTHLRRVK